MNKDPLTIIKAVRHPALRSLATSRHFAILIMSVALFACGGENVSDLETYVQKVKLKKRGKVPPLPKPQEFGTYEYVSNSLRDPFKPKVKVVENPSGNSNIKSKCLAPRDVLETFPLDTLRIVGTLEKNGVRWALIKAASGTLYRTKKGKCMGQNNGKIIRVTESNVELLEVVRDGLGNNIERKTILSVVE